MKIERTIAIIFAVAAASCVLALAACNPPKEPTYYVSYKVAFDTDGGSIVELQNVGNGETASKPTDPTKNGFVFDGWTLDGTDYDFSSPVTKDVTLVARWASKTALLDVAFAKDYVNYTLERTVYELEYPELIDTYVFKRTATAAYHVVHTGGGIDKDEYVMELDADGTATKGYFYNSAEQKWKKSSLTSFGTVTFAVDFSDFVGDDFTVDGDKFLLKEEHNGAAAMQFFGWTSDVSDVWLTVKDGYVEKIGCLTSGDTLVVDQTISAIGNTRVDLPTVLAEINITSTDKTVFEGEAVDVKSMFTVTEDGQSVAVTDDMLDLDGLNAENPVKGTYTVTLTYVSTDNQTVNKTATVTVSERKEETFAEVFAKDYSNVTVTKDSDVFKIDGNITLKGTNLYYVFGSSEYPTQYNSNTNAQTVNSKVAMVRLDILTKLNAEYFVYDETTQTYVAQKGEYDVVNAKIKEAVFIIDPNNKYFDDTAYSISIKVEGGYINQVVYRYKSGFSESMAKDKVATMILSDIGTTDLGVIPEGVLELAGRTQTAAMSAKSYALPVRREDNRI